MSSLHDHAVDELGRRVVGGTLPAGAVVLADDLAVSLGVGRSVIREAIRVLRSLGLVTSVKRVGIRVLPASEWNVFDPHVIAWRIAVTDDGAQLRSLTELRTAVEPFAAELAARHASPELGAELLAVAAHMRTIGRSGDLDAFLELDIRFHALVLKASGNEMFSAMNEMIAAVLRGRTDLGLMPTHPHEEALQWHMDVAEAVHAAHPQRAHDAMELIMRRTVSEVEHVWDGVPRG
ncbi:FadR/GntR family transcriptional regulator [Marisediminicola sp. LYQ134]|uniref:FadR/GntR family transcriptional regulator n=1 Tax=unclassified Marisediminicola TaxID=2618316 RepID=UPI003982DB62